MQAVFVGVAALTPPVAADGVDVRVLPGDGVGASVEFAAWVTSGAVMAAFADRRIAHDDTSRTGS